jgi:hypothetical protein
MRALHRRCRHTPRMLCRGSPCYSLCMYGQGEDIHERLPAACCVLIDWPDSDKPQAKRGSPRHSHSDLADGPILAENLKPAAKQCWAASRVCNELQHTCSYGTGQRRTTLTCPQRSSGTVGCAQTGPCNHRIIWKRVDKGTEAHTGTNTCCG